MMKTVFNLVLCFLIPLAVLATNPKKSKLSAKAASVVKLADGFAFTEGPAADKNGNVYFTDQPFNKIYVWTTEGKLETFHENSGRANGLYFDHDGKLLSCSDMDNELWSISADKSHKKLVLDYEGKKLNGPNDLWVRPDGGIYFTDPLYVRPYWTRSPDMEQDGEHVYFLSPDRKTLSRVANDLVKPNGIVGTPDGKKLYVADIGAGKTYVYDIQSDGSLANKKLFTEMGSDGMTIDNKGNIYLTGNGVTVFDKKGRQVEYIKIDAGWTANVCFGGKNMKTLFITASEYLYSLEMKVKGIK
ncbi:MAG: SMP-30/gluconolactonase/LRE family protein [Bacteroidales bacterium]|nr:SMP-30/gluconolactonase/LRE family protein [Bacteroidales bacterium]